MYPISDLKVDSWLLYSIPWYFVVPRQSKSSQKFFLRLQDREHSPKEDKEIVSETAAKAKEPGSVEGAKKHGATFDFEWVLQTL
jgi:hypothetical protein